MTKHITRYFLNEIKILRIRKKGSGKTVELSVDSLLQATDGDEFNDIRILEDFQTLQSVLKRLREKRDFEIEMDFED